MRVTIDNLDGLGALEYTGSVCAEGRLRLERKLNAPSRCVFTVLVGGGGLALPVRLARVVVTADDDAVLFTGYVTTEPVRMLAGMGLQGAVYRARVTAVSDEWLLDRQASGAAVAAGGASGLLLGLDARGLVGRLASRAQGGAGGIGVSAGVAVAAVGPFAVEAAVPWSVNAGAAASAGYAGYRAVAGEVALQPAGAVVHVLGDADGADGILDVKALQVGAVRELANDVTVSGGEEAAAYVQESFLGDGSTTAFELGEAVFAGSAKKIAEDAFTGATFDATLWAVSDPGSHLSLTAAGLTMSGGNGLDGQTMLTALDAVEMAGTVVVELGSVVLGAASDGMMAGMYEGSPVLADCFAGFRVRQSAGATTLIPVLNGVEVGTSFAPASGHAYTLRLRLHCVEMQRVMQRYYAMVDGVVESFGSASGVAAPMDVVFELVDQGTASNTPATVLYDSAVGGDVAGVVGTPATCSLVVVNSTQLFGSVGSVSVTRPGSAWVVSTLPSGVRQTRLMGKAGEGVDCTLANGSTAGSGGKVTFFSGRVPVTGERVTVTYRTSQRSVARLENAASVAVEALGGGNGTCRWLGKVLQPAARSSADCESAASAVLAAASARTAAVAGTYAAVNPASDVWPGDVLSVTSDGVTSALLVRSVAVVDGGAVPEVLSYSIAFANDWGTEFADGLGVRVSEDIAADAVLPVVALPAVGMVLGNLQELAVTAVSDTAISVDAGLAAPAGGGFEVRRKDWAFGASVDAVDLVLRSPVRSFSIPRAAQVERYFVRMYDGSTPRVYSRFSAAVFVNWPVL